MTWFYLRWGALVLAAVTIGLLAYQRYETDLKVVAPSELIRHPPRVGSPLRVQGMVASGSLHGQVEHGMAQFELADESASIRVDYHGPPPENLRELKTVVIIGTWDADTRVFRAHDLALVSNYGFVASAYLLTFIPIGIILFFMTRKVSMLMQEIKRSKLYEPGDDLDGHDA